MFTRMYEKIITVIQDTVKKISPYVPAPVAEFAKTYWFFANPNTVTSVRYEVAKFLDPLNSPEWAPLPITVEESQKILIRSPEIRQALSNSAKTNLIIYIGATWFMQVAIKRVVNYMAPDTVDSTLFNLSLPFLLLRYITPGAFVDNSLYGPILATHLTANKKAPTYFQSTCKHDDDKRASANFMSSIYYLFDSTLLALIWLLSPILRPLVFLLMCLREGQVLIEGNFALANVCSEDRHIAISKNPVPILAIGAWLFSTQYFGSTVLSMFGLQSSFSEAALGWFLYHYGLIVGYELKELPNSGPTLDFFKYSRMGERKLLTFAKDQISARLNRANTADHFVKLSWYYHAYPNMPPAAIIGCFKRIGDRYKKSGLTQHYQRLETSTNPREYLAREFPQITQFNAGKFFGLCWYFYAHPFTQTMFYMGIRNDLLVLDNLLARDSIQALMRLKGKGIRNGLQTFIDYCEMKYCIQITEKYSIQVPEEYTRRVAKGLVNYFCAYVPDVFVSEEKVKLIKLLADKIIFNKDISVIINYLETVKSKIASIENGSIDSNRIKVKVAQSQSLTSLIQEDYFQIKETILGANLDEESYRLVEGFLMISRYQEKQTPKKVTKVDSEIRVEAKPEAKQKEDNGSILVSKETNSLEEEFEGFVDLGEKVKKTSVSGSLTDFVLMDYEQTSTVQSKAPIQPMQKNPMSKNTIASHFSVLSAPPKVTVSNDPTAIRQMVSQQLQQRLKPKTQ